MTSKTLLALVLTFTFGLTAAFAQDEDTELGKQMKTINKSLRTLKKQVADPAKKDENLGLVATMKKGVEEAKKLEPDKTKDVPAAEKAAYLEKYKGEIAELGKTVDALEAAVKADKPDEAKAIFDKLNEQKKKGHKDFAPEDDKK